MFRLLADFRYEYGDRWSGQVAAVPAGFETDFASTPRFFWRIVPPAGKYTKAAVVHDWLYRSGLLSRREADRVFFLAMTDLGVPWWNRWLMWAAVRLGGAKAFAGGERSCVA